MNVSERKPKAETELAYVGRTVLIGCGVGLLLPRTMRTAAIAPGNLLCLCALLTQVPRSAGDPGNISFRTTVFEPLAIAGLRSLLPGPNGMLFRAERPIRWLLAALSVFGVDHFIALKPIASVVCSPFGSLRFTCPAFWASMTLRMGRAIQTSDRVCSFLLALWSGSWALACVRIVLQLPVRQMLTLKLSGWRILTRISHAE